MLMTHMKLQKSRFRNAQIGSQAMLKHSLAITCSNGLIISSNSQTWDVESLLGSECQVRMRVNAAC